VLLRNLILAPIALCAAAALAGCGASSDIFSSDTKVFSRSVDFFSTKDWGRAPTAAEISLTRTVTPDDYVDASGACSAAAAPAPEPAVAESTAATPASNLPPRVVGGVGLGMTECQVVHRAGQPSQINIGAEGTDRKAVLTYDAKSTWPGIYTFVGGRLTEIEAVAMPEPVKPAKKRPASKPKTAAR
jgi:hypothetical protein